MLHVAPCVRTHAQTRRARAGLRCAPAASHDRAPTRRARYAAFQAQGSYVQWPATDWCPTDYDPRFRSWYVSAASGPKDVVIVLDTSGSMTQQNRMNIMGTAALRLLNTFTDVDHVAMVQFNTRADSPSTTLRRATLSLIHI